MCGVTGLVDCRRERTTDELLRVVGRMTEPLAHRGPDDEGAWVDAVAGVALGHRRLAVIDLSDAGKQPMVSPSGRYVLTYNGELYNSEELRHQLVAKGFRFRGHSDTESLLAAIEEHGVEGALRIANGMFALAVWDRKERRLCLARDRIGEKPLYYGWVGDTFVFGSELKALRAHPEFSPSIDRGALALYFRHNCVPAPRSIYAGIHKLPAGTVVTIDGDRPREAPAPAAYWSARECAELGASNPMNGDPAALADELDVLLRDAVRLRMQADVPLGALLSGGIDSSTVTALMQAQSSRRVKTFTIGFDNPDYDESAQAAAVAAHLGTDHTELTVSSAEAIATVPLLPAVYDEPFSDSSQIPTLLVSQLARKEVTVALSGDGGDELFGGYNRYTWCPSIWKRIHRLPRRGRLTAAAALRLPSHGTWSALFGMARPVLPPRLRHRDPGAKIDKIADVLGAESLEDTYRRVTSHFQDPLALVLGTREPLTVLTDPTTWAVLSDPVSRMMYLDTVTYLPDDILVKLDRASMAVSLEARVPMLDHRVVEFALRLPLEMKLHAGRGKWLLRKVLHRYVPESLVDRPKAGFALPLGDWLRQPPLREWAESLLDPRRLRQDGLLDPAAVQRVWDAHITGRRDLAPQVWDVLMFQSWHEATVLRKPAPA